MIKAVFFYAAGTLISHNHNAVYFVIRRKRTGIKEYLRINNIKKEETMAFGDGENDIEMIKYVQIGVAMGNADDYVKENADYVTSSVDNNGIKEALVALQIIS